MVAPCECTKSTTVEAMLTVVEDVKHLGGAILCNAGKQLPIAAGRNADDRRQMSTVVLHEFDPLVLFLPELDVTIDGSGHQVVGSIAFA